jgi:F-type H+-transporting ATPase subunit a
MFQINWLSPLEQFNVFSFFIGKLPIFMKNGWVYLFTNVTLTFALLGIFLFFVFFILISPKFAIFNLFIMFVSSYYGFCITLLKENFTKKGLFFFPYVFSLFSFLLLANLFGMVPYSFAITSHLIITLFLSFITFFTSVYLCVHIHGTKFFSLFLPAGAPFILIPFLIILELISFSARLFSLAIRLFANIMSGHTLLKILASFVWLLFIKASLLFAVPFIVILAVSFL